MAAEGGAAGAGWGWADLGSEVTEMVVGAEEEGWARLRLNTPRYTHQEIEDTM